MNELLLKGGLAALDEGLRAVDIRVSDTCIREIGPNLRPGRSSCREVDCNGLYVLPGLIDMHVHIDDTIGPFPLADTWQTGSTAAITSGITTLVGFATQGQNQTISQSVDDATRKAAGTSFCDYQLHITPKRWDSRTWQELEILRKKGFSTLKLYTTYPEQGLYSTYQDIRKVMDLAKCNGYTVLLHCEDQGVLTRAKTTSRGTSSDPKSHGANRPSEAETKAISEAISICMQTFTPLHIVHVSTPKGAELIRAASSQCPITAETCFQYLALSDSSMATQIGHRFLCSPPLRTEAERKELLEMVKCDAIDVLATDHCAFEKAVKDSGADQSINNVPNGLPGIGSLLPLAREFLIRDPARDLPSFVRMLARNPAKICGLYPKKGSLRVGADADIAVIDLFATPSEVQSSLADVYDPYRNTLARFEAKRVYLRGSLVVEDASLAGQMQAQGKLACQK